MAPARIMGALDAPAPMLALDRSFGIITETYEGAVDFRGTAISPAASSLALRVLYQSCDDRVCLPPTTIDVPVSRIAAVAAVRVHDSPRAREGRTPNDVPAAPLVATATVRAATDVSVLVLGP